MRFVIKNFGLKTEGNFKGLRGRIHFDPATPAASDFNVTVEAVTINTGNKMRDRDLKEAKYFDAGRHPFLKFSGSKVKAIGTGRYTVAGELRIKDVSRPIQFDFTAKPYEGGYLFEGAFALNRLDYKVGSSSMSLQDNVQVFLSVVAK